MPQLLPRARSPRGEPIAIAASGVRRAGTRAVALVATALVLGVPTAGAESLEPRAYSNAPVGLNFAVAGYSYSHGQVVTDAAVPLEDGEIDVHGALLAYARSFGILGRSAKVDVVLPYAWVSGSATFAGEPRTREVDGLADPRIRLSVNFLGAPALDLAQFAAYEQDVILGASLQVTVPLGQYDSDKLVNIGTNRWSVKPEVGLSKLWRGRLTTELAAGVRFYSDNDDFLDGQERAQDPLYSVRAHLIYSFGRGFWGSLDATWYGGGKTTVDDVTNDDRQASTRLGLTLALPVTRHHSLKLYASTGVSVRTGGSFDVVGMAWQVRWGGGL